MKKYYLVLQFIALGLTLFSQELKVHKTDGTVSVFQLSQIDSITFSQGNTIPTEGLIAYYPFNGNANDESGNGNNGTVYGASLSEDRFGINNKAYSFDGSNDYISNILSMSSTDSLTICLWYNSPVPINISSTHFEMWESGNEENQIHLNFSYNSPSAYLYTWITGIGQGDDLSAPRSFNEWHYVVIVKAGNTETVYFDGQPDFGVFTGTNLDFDFDKFEFGREFTTAGSVSSTYFNGKLDDVRFYNRALSESEINSLYHEGGWSGIESGLVAFYPFNGNANDESGNGNNGTVYGASLSEDRFGINNKAYSFNGISNYIQCNTIPVLDQIFTYSAWIKVTRPSGEDINNNFGNFGTIGTGYDTWGMSYNVTTQHFWISDHINGSYGYSTYLGDGWKFVVVKYDQTTRSLYIDGNLVATQNITTPIPSLPSDILRIGCHTSSVVQQFMGSIDDIRIFNRALSESEINLLYHEGGWQVEN